MLASKSVLV